MSINISSQVPSNVAAFIKSFYAISDDESKHQEYVQSFIGQGVHFQIGPMRPATGPEGIHAWRVEKWAPVAVRKHSVYDVFVNPDKKDEFMLYGLVEYNLKDGSDGKADWGGRMVFDDVTKVQGLQMKSYTVWITPEQK